MMQDGVAVERNLCDSCVTKGCVFQSGIIRSHCDFYNAEKPKGKWIIDDLDEYYRGKIWKCHCSKCGKDPLNYVFGTENWWLCKTQMPKYCPNCGIEMEVE